MTQVNLIGGISITKKSVKWRLNRIVKLFAHDWYFKQQKFTFQVTSFKGVTSKWSVNLDFKEDSEEQNNSSSSSKGESNLKPTQYLSLSVELVSTSNGSSFVNAEIIPEFEGINGSIILKESSELGDSCRFGVGKSNFWSIKSIPIHDDIGYRLLKVKDGTLMVKLEIAIFEFLDQTHE